MKLGIGSYTYTWSVGVPGSEPASPLTMKGLIDIAYREGIELVQIADNLPAEKLSRTELEDLLRYAEERKVSIETGGRGLIPENVMTCLRTAEYLNSPILRMVIDKQGFEPDLRSIISIIKDLIPELKSRNIKLAVENHDRLKAREFEKIILAAGTEWVGICLDSVNSMGAGEGFETVSEILAPYTINLHIKDFTIHRVSHKMGFVTEGRPAGKGMLDIPGLVSSINSYGRCNSAILELWTPPAENIQATIEKEVRWAEESINYLKQFTWEN